MRSRGRSRSGPGGPSRRACPARRCRAHGPSARCDRPSGMILEVLRPVALDARLLKALAPELTLRPGQSVVARVAEKQGPRGTINLAGVALAAELPPDVHEGDRLRLTVQDATPERVVLKLESQLGGPAVQQSVGLRLPGGAHARVTWDGEEEGARGAAGEPGACELIYDSPRLGRLAFRIESTGAGIVATVGVPPGALAEAQGTAA